MPIPDWQLPAGVDRGLWDYLHSGEMVAGYDAQMAASPLAAADVRFCETWFPTPGRLLDLGCGTGRLCRHFAAKGYECVGVDLSDEMLEQARANAPAATFVNANLVELGPPPGGGFDYAACLFSTLGMVRGGENRGRVLANAFRALKPGGRFVLHVHNRHFRGLSAGRVMGQAMRTLLGRPSAGDVTMPQAYAGAPLTLHHFTKRGSGRALVAAGFRVLECVPLGLGGRLERPWFLPSVRAYGWLFAAERPTEAGQSENV